MSRIHRLDYARTLAIFFVVVTHLVSNFGYANTEFARVLFYMIDLNGVPLFYMISGVLLFSKDTHKNTLSKVIKFLLSVSVAAMATNFVHNYFLDAQGLWQSLSTAIIENNMFTTSRTAVEDSKLGHGIIMVGTGDAYQLWYMLYFIPVWLMAIVASDFIKKSKENLVKLCIALFILGPVMQNVAVFFGLNGYLAVLTKADFFSYLLYMCLGYLIYNIKDKPYIKPALILTVIVTIATVLIVYHHERLTNNMTWYTANIPTYITSSLIFYSICGMKKERLPRLTAWVSPNSYGIYLYHMAFIYFLKYVAGESMNHIGPKLVFSVLVFLSIGLFVYLIRKARLNYLI